jgi:calcineurin-like phosphoesterase family protein
MSVVYMTSDWHLGHKGVERFRTEFGSCSEMEGLILENYLSAVGKRDIVWMLGDMCFDMDSIMLMRTLPGDKRFVMGNHDTDKCRGTEKVDIEQIVLTYDQVHSMARYKHSWLTHAPIHPDELRGKINIHGHVHRHSIEDDRYVNVCLEATDWKPKKYQEILDERK